jgi:hypothetical protein
VPDEISLREYVDERFAAQEKAVGAALAAAEKAVAAALAAADRAVAKAEAASERRFDSVNEFRAALNDNTRTLIPRAEAEERFKGLTEKLDMLTARMNARDERGRGAGEMWGFVVGGVGLLLAIVSIAIVIFGGGE